MFDTEKTTIGRRQFLRGAAYAVGAATVVMNLTDNPAEAVDPASTQSTASTDLSISYVDGERLVAGETVTADPSLMGQSVRMRISGRRVGDSLRSVDAHFTQDNGRVSKFHAWSLSGADAVFTMPVEADGFKLSVAARDGQHELTLKARTGTYLLALNGTAAAMSIVAEEGGCPVLRQRSFRGVVPARIDHVFVTVERV